MSFYNFKLNDPSSFSTSSPDSKSQNRFVHKTFEDYSKPKPPPVEEDGEALSRRVMNQDGRGKFAVQGYNKPSTSTAVIAPLPGPYVLV